MSAARLEALRKAADEQTWTIMRAQAELEAARESCCDDCGKAHVSRCEFILATAHAVLDATDRAIAAEEGA